MSGFINCKIRGIGCNPEEYHNKGDMQRGDPKWPMSPSTLRTIGTCASRWRAGYESPESKASKWGSLLDCLVLTPGQFDNRYRIEPLETLDAKGKMTTSHNTTAFKEWKAACLADGLIPIKQSGRGADDDTSPSISPSLEEAKKAKARLCENPVLAEFLDATDKQVWVIGEWQDTPSGLTIPVQCLIDFVPKKDSRFASDLGDLKSCRNAHPRKFEGDSTQRGYPIQAAFDLDLFNAATGETRDTWRFMLSENVKPYETGWMMMELEKVDCGRVIYQACLSLYCRCLKTGIWPGYQGHSGTIDGCDLDRATARDEEMKARALDLANAGSIIDSPPVDDQIHDDLV